MQLSTLHEWYKTDPGQWLLQFEQEQISKWLPLIRGATVIQIGGLPDTFSIAQHQNKDYYFLSASPQAINAPGVDVLALGDELPFLPNSVNLVLLIHVLEYIEHPTVVLKEIFDILAPNGKLLLFCFNPWSSWGLHKLLKKNNTFPWSGKFISPWRLQNWLASLGYNTIKDKTLGYRLPFRKRRLTHLAFFFEALGQIAIPRLGAVNVFLVEKRVYGAIKNRRYQWQKQRVINGGVIEPTTRIKSEHS